jgi:hypothetical protein
MVYGVWGTWYGVWAVGGVIQAWGMGYMGYGIGTYIDMKAWRDNIMGFAHETPCQGHHTRI